MKKIFISLLLALSLFFTSCVSTPIKINGVEINKTQAEVDTNDILPWTIVIITCGVMYVGLPCVIMGNLKHY